MQHEFPYFVLPFTIGIGVLLLYLFVKYVRWISKFDRVNKKRIKKNIISVKTLRALKEIFLESLIHNKIFKTNPLLGYMHMCFGFGWFLLIVIGKIESLCYHFSLVNPPYFSIFFDYFHNPANRFVGDKFFAFVMDLILLVILSGLAFALAKRMRSSIMGMKKITKHNKLDSIIILVLWLIFPIRFVAESVTSAIKGGGGFLTGTAGNLFAETLPVHDLYVPLWGAYSLALGIFFVLLPFSRYMHIPTEMVYIFLKNWGIKLKGKDDTYAQFQIFSCSRCGICVDSCQLNTSLGMSVQPVYFIRAVRHGYDYTNMAENCLQCGRCEVACPVDIEINNLRLAHKTDIGANNKFDFINPQPAAPSNIAYFAGCMGHLTPQVTNAMRKIFEAASVKYTFIDEHGSVCCGRPMKISGNIKAANEIAKRNKDMIQSSGVQTLVTSCPICYKIFKDDYSLNIEVLHHTQYINRLIETKAINVSKTTEKTLFHNPCDLGRGSGVYDAPNNILNNVSNKLTTAFDNQKSLCCGGSLANNFLTPQQKYKLSSDVIAEYAIYKPDSIVTACPLCVKTLGKASNNVPVKDIAEVVANSL